MLLKHLIYFLSVLVYAYCDATEENPVVPTDNGLVRGRLAHTVGHKRAYYAFRGIPFAEPPVGNLRFSPPVPRSNWEGTLDATRDGAICVQGSDPVEGSEDCLFINVYTPELPSTKAELLPTMIFIYGGAFTGGHSRYENLGPDYLLERDVVIVTFNYRVGVFGFISTGDLEAPGNAGLKDQVLALQWVQRNIARFGGNPQAVTLFGQSAGAASVSYHLQSPLSRGLFSRTIIQSGVSLSPWTLARSAPQSATALGSRLSISGTDSRSIIQGLRNVDYRDLQIQASEVLSSNMLTSNPLHGFTFAPVIEPQHEGAFITQRSHEQLSKGDFARVPTLIGYNSLEGAFAFGTLLRLLLVRYDLNPGELVPVDLNLGSDIIKYLLGRLIRDKYFQGVAVSRSNLTLMHFISHDQFVRPTREFVRLISQHVPTYLYRFSYQGGLWGLSNDTFPGATHSEELGYIWRSEHPASDQDEIVRQRMTSFWTNFAKTGNPTPSQQRLFQNQIWLPTDEKYRFIDIGRDLVPQENPEQDFMEFWDDVYLTHGVPPYDTY